LQQNKKKVIICPLDWGLGHASRMIPVVHRYLAGGHVVILGVSGKSGDLLKSTFPELLCIPLPSPAIRYTGKGKWLIPLLLCQMPGMILSAIKEHRRIQNIVEEHHMDTIVSDNRYGLFCRQAYCIFVTHQVSPVLPLLLRWAEYPVYRIIRNIIHRYNECWIPDNSDQELNLSGKLSHRFKLPRNARYVGILSRFKALESEYIPELTERYELVFILSGPEPQLSNLYELFLTLALKIRKKILIITGFKQEFRPFEIPEDGQITLVSHLEPLPFSQVLIHSRAIICRSGYSGIMDLVALGKTALLVPTPGQPEQEYLAEYLSQKGCFTRILQDELDENILMKYLNEQSVVK
jgi:hypothetical protein